VEEMQQTMAVVAVLMALGGAIYLLRSKGIVQFGMKNAGAGVRRLQAIERLPLTPQHSLHLVKVAGRVMLIAVSPQGCSILDGKGWEPAHGEGDLGG
jgi:flagellar biogenesis protein FliO